MAKKSSKKKEPVKKELEGYPVYPPSDDIYNKEKKEKNIDPEDTSQTKKPVGKPRVGKLNEKGFEEAESGSDLDVPGSELDEQEQNEGSEDEENNFYSLGGDAHNELDEDKGE